VKTGEALEQIIQRVRGRTEMCDCSICNEHENHRWTPLCNLPEANRPYSVLCIASPLAWLYGTERYAHEPCMRRRLAQQRTPKSLAAPQEEKNGKA